MIAAQYGGSTGFVSPGFGGTEDFVLVDVAIDEAIVVGIHTYRSYALVICYRDVRQTYVASVGDSIDPLDGASFLNQQTIPLDRAVDRYFVNIDAGVETEVIGSVSVSLSNGAIATISKGAISGCRIGMLTRLPGGSREEHFFRPTGC